MKAGSKKVLVILPEKIEHHGAFSVPPSEQARPKYSIVVDADTDAIKRGDKVYYAENMARPYNIDGVDYEVIDQDYIDLIETTDGK